MARHCKNCGQTGHYAKTCKAPKKDVVVEQVKEDVKTEEEPIVTVPAVGEIDEDTE